MVVLLITLFINFQETEVNYQGTFEVHVYRTSWTTMIEAACPMKARHRSDHLIVLELQDKQSELPALCESLKSLGKAIESQLAREKDVSKARTLMHTKLTLSIWEKKRGVWSGSILEPKSLPGFPNCHMTEIDFLLAGEQTFLGIEKNTVDLQPDDRSGDLHRSIIITENFYGGGPIRDVEKLSNLLEDEKSLGEIFSCFDALG